MAESFKLPTAYDIASDLFFSAKAGEGRTVDRDDIPLPADGYYVGGIFPSLVFDSVDEIDRGELAWWIGSNHASFYGVWADQETGKIYFDGSSWVFDVVNAMELGRIRGEIAVWDIANGKEIRVSPLGDLT